MLIGVLVNLIGFWRFRISVW